MREFLVVVASLTANDADQVERFGPKSAVGFLEQSVELPRYFLGSWHLASERKDLRRPQR
jgi:hypothetical protein